ncbi:MAG TPA: hypothetical protein PKJ41_13420 [Bryobacteraceae bacterium]|nr:hypothetical protein [Bryobacteraceae bacterium]
MSKFLILALMTCALGFGGDKKPAGDAQAVQKCLEGCTKKYDSCKKSATSKTAIQGCEKSKDICRAACNK